MIIAPIDLATAHPKAKALLGAVQQKLGATPNLMRVLANNPAVLEAYLSFTGALGQGTLGDQINSQIALAVAETNGSRYCLAAHTALGQGNGLEPAAILAARQSKASDRRAAAALTLARALVEKRGRATADDVGVGRAAGLSDADIIEVLAAVAINIFTNYVNATAATEIDFPPAEQVAGAA
jgi:uncharacterized peroxidase-related enzyme